MCACVCGGIIVAEGKQEREKPGNATSTLKQDVSYCFFDEFPVSKTRLIVHE